MIDDRKKSLWPWIVALLSGLPVVYVASFGPAVWLMAWLLNARIINEGGQVPFLVIYYPLVSAAERTDVLGAMLDWYAHIFG